MDWLGLCVLAFLAGLVDSMAGGGGLIQLPALFLFLPGTLSNSVALVLVGTHWIMQKGNRLIRVVRGFNRFFWIAWPPYSS